ncbi:hypothetical protein [Nisaea sediminum]|uniref:hypothetical protein n=1 Tax=Nisaea sediminum TaxID=2775867 RepID=UPI00186753C4|nr:hypothetical protein [Nisaea sediminum]
MEDDPVDLDDRRSTEGLMATNIRRHSLKDDLADQEMTRLRHEELEAQMQATPAETWPAAALKAQYLIRLYARTREAGDPRHQKLIERVLGDFARLMEKSDQGNES